MSAEDHDPSDTDIEAFVAELREHASTHSDSKDKLYRAADLIERLNHRQ